MKLIDQWIAQFEIVAPVASIVFGGIWFLIKTWSNDQKKIKQLEVDTILSNIRSLDIELKEHKKYQSILSKVLHATREELIAIKTRLDSNIKNEDTFIKSIEYLRKITEEKISVIEATLSDSEIVKLPGNRFMIRGRKD